jgi:dolichyl-phosphate beta-glucosyltransferase
LDPAVTLILPAYNEAGSINATLDDAKAYFERRQISHEIIVSAQGNDGTREAVAKRAQTDPALMVIGDENSRGKGLGIRQAVPIAHGQVIGFADADNKTPIDEFDKVAPLLDSGYDIVIGSRGLADSQIERAQPWFRRWGSRGFGVFMHLAVGLPDIVDTQCGFKFFKRDVAIDLFRRQQIDGYMFDVEILYLAKLLEYRIAQVPVRWHDDGDSRLHLFSENIQHVREVLKIRSMSARSVGASNRPVIEATPGLANAHD